MHITNPHPHNDINHDLFIYSTRMEQHENDLSDALPIIDKLSYLININTH